MPHQDYPFGYCTNVHAGPTLAEAQANLSQYAAAVREHLGISGRLPVGLWLPQPAAESLAQPAAVAAFKDWLAVQSLAAYTLNGFPQGDFHQAVVKHDVYVPTWDDPCRRDYTLKLASILQQLGPIDGLGSISTLPLGWPHQPWNNDRLQHAAGHLQEVAVALDQILQTTGTEIVLAIEPEPGCVLNTAAEIVSFFEHYLLAGETESIVRRHLSVCHDICHSGVMFEPQTVALQSYLDAGIRVGKVQVSSAVHVPWDACTNSEERAALQAQLAGFNEPKYLHQVTRSDAAGRLAELLEDLPLALSTWLNQPAPPSTPWRVHFHVPIFVEQFEHLRTTQADIREALAFLEGNRPRTIGDCPWFTGHYEVETYAWPVLPPDLAAADLASGIATELQFLKQLLDRLGNA